MSLNNANLKFFNNKKILWLVLIIVDYSEWFWLAVARWLLEMSSFLKKAKVPIEWLKYSSTSNENLSRNEIFPYATLNY